MKVFGIGLNKTGTTTLDACLGTLGYDVKGCDLELTRCAVQGSLAPIFRVADRYDGFQDWPWPLVYQELDARYPSSKFILTTRSDSETWFQSLKEHADRKGPTEYRKLVYRHEMPHQKKKHHIEIYERHNQNVRDHFHGREDDLLEVCWEEESGWKELCEFLGHEIPDRSFPHAKESPHWLERSLYEVKVEMKRIFGFRPEQ
mgnify:CR=1 FL=1